MGRSTQVVIENNNLSWGPGGTVGSEKTSFAALYMLCFSVAFDWGAATPLGHPALRWPDHPKLPSKAAMEVRERTKRSLWH